MENKMRAFVAVELPEAVRTALWDESARLRSAGGRVSWVRPTQMHLTLRFLGDITAEQGSVLAGGLAGVCTDFAPLRLAVAEIGVFPNLRRPSVIWAGVRLLSGDLAGLQSGIERVAQGAGLAPDNKPFHPHVTLGRVRALSGGGGLMDALMARTMGVPPVFGDEFEARAVALFRSDLRPGGPVHTRLEEFFLSCKFC